MLAIHIPRGTPNGLVKGTVHRFYIGGSTELSHAQELGDSKLSAPLAATVDHMVSRIGPKS